MARDKAARSSCNCARAKVSYRDTDRIAQNLRSDWERGCFWAGLAVVLTFGPMLALGIWNGWC